MDASVIIASGRKEISATLDSLLALEGGFEFEIIVVHDSAKKPDGKISDGKILFVESASKNPAVKRNLGATRARGKVLAFIDDDATAAPDWLREGIDTLKRNSDAAGCGGPNLAPADSTPDEILTDAILSTKPGSGSSSYAAGGDERIAHIGEIHLANMFIKRDVYFSFCGLNEALGYGAEDSEFIQIVKRMSRSDFVYNPKVVVYHRRRKFGRDLFSQRYKFRKQNGRLMWLRPSMYLTKKRAIFCAAALAYFAAATIFPFLFFGAILYPLFLAYPSRSVKNVSKAKWIAGVFALHVVSFAGLIAGAICPPGAAEYSALLRRPR